MSNIKFRVFDRERIISLSMAFTLGIVTIQDDDSDSEWANDLTEEFEGVVLMQYTGIKDKNGKEIYEGDIVSVTGSKSVGVYTTCIIKDGQGFKIKDNKTIIMDYKEMFLCTIIGNIYENPELLTGDRYDE